MILINLLPHREARLKRRQQAFFNQLGMALVLAGVMAVVAFAGYQQAIASQQSRTGLLQLEIARLDGDIKAMAELQKGMASLRARQTALELLQAERNLPVHLLQELVLQMPDGVYLHSLKQEGQNVLLTGMAQSQERVSELLRKLDNSAWLSRPELIEIVAATTVEPKRPQGAVASFTIRVLLPRSSTPVRAVSERLPLDPGTASNHRQ
jgi:type IV pilus assembly protein PilN